MTVNVECPCGASMSIEDAAEPVVRELLDRWQTAHQDHRRTLEEYQAYVTAVHGRG